MLAEWRRAIPEVRDRLQSRVLVGVVSTALVADVGTVLLLGGQPHVAELLAFKAVGVSLTFGALVWALRAATPVAAMLGGTICFVIITGSAGTNESVYRSGLSPLIALFALTFAATRAGRAKKTTAGLAEKRTGRNAGQVMANLGATALVVLGQVTGWCDLVAKRAELSGSAVRTMPTLLLAVLCEATADTVSSEIGQAFGGTPLMLTTLRRVDAGTDGAVSLLGTAAGAIAAASVAGAGLWAMQMSVLDAGIALAGGLAGLIFDSLLGATLERRGWLGNDLVNFLSTLFAAVFAFGLLAALAGR